MKTALVTGAGGFIGRALVQCLRTRPGMRVLELVRSPDPQANGKDVLVASLEELDAAFWKAHGVEQIDILYHLAAFAPKDAAAADMPAQIIQNNIVGTARLLATIPGKPQTVVFVSSVDIYERGTGQPINEDTPVSPMSLHGASKVFGEYLTRQYATVRACRGIILRLGHIFGPGEGAYRKIIPEIIRKMLAGEDLRISGDGSATRDYLYVSDAAEAIARASVLDGPPQTLNVVRGESVTVRYLVETIAKMLDYQRPVHYSESLGCDTLAFDNRRMREALNMHRFVSLESGLQAEIEYFRGLPT